MSEENKNQEKVRIFVERGSYEYGSAMILCVNDDMIVLERGKEHMVDPKFAALYEETVRKERAEAEYKAELRRKISEKAREAGALSQ